MFNDRVTLVTGGGTVVGKAIGVQLAKNGSKVALASRDPAHLSASSSGPSNIPQYRECSPWPGYTAYCTTKHGMIGFNRGLPSEQFKAKSWRLFRSEGSRS